MHPRGLPTSAFHVLPMYFLAAHRLAEFSDTKVLNVVTQSSVVTRSTDLIFRPSQV